MAVNIDYIDDHILFITYTGLIKPVDLLDAYTEVYEYSQTQEVHYILIYAVEAMYYQHELFSPELLQLKRQVIEQESFKATIAVSLLSQSLRQTMQDTFHKWGLGHKLYFMKDREAAYDFIASHKE